MCNYAIIFFKFVLIMVTLCMQACVWVVTCADIFSLLGNQLFASVELTFNAYVVGSRHLCAVLCTYVNSILNDVLEPSQNEDVYLHPDLIILKRILLANGNYTNSFGHFWPILRTQKRLFYVSGNHAQKCCNPLWFLFRVSYCGSYRMLLE